MMDDNELQNEQEKREHELELERIRHPRPPMTGWEAFWNVVGDNIFWVFLIIAGIVGAIVSIKTGQKFSAW
jgi:hypothetical protein